MAKRKAEVKEELKKIPTRLESLASGVGSLVKSAARGVKNLCLAILGSGKSVLDTLLHKVVSRKLLTFGIATGLLSQGNLESSDWTIIACIYIGVQGAIDFWKVRHGVSS